MLAGRRLEAMAVISAGFALELALRVTAPMLSVPACAELCAAPVTEVALDTLEETTAVDTAVDDEWIPPPTSPCAYDNMPCGGGGCISLHVREAK